MFYLAPPKKAKKKSFVSSFQGKFADNGSMSHYFIFVKMHTLGNDGEVIHPFIRLTNMIPEGWPQVVRGSPESEKINLNLWMKTPWL